MIKRKHKFDTDFVTALLPSFQRSLLIKYTKPQQITKKKKKITFIYVKKIVKIFQANNTSMCQLALL